MSDRDVTELTGLLEDHDSTREDGVEVAADRDVHFFPKYDRIQK